MALLLAAAFLPAAQAASNNIAYWTNPSAAIIRNQIFIDGGDRFDGDTTASTRWTGPGGYLYNISLCNSFNTLNESDPEYFLNHLSITSESQPPFFVAGAMFANDNEFYTYGGMKYSNGSAIDNGVIYGSVFPPDIQDLTGWNSGFTYDWSANNLSATTRKLTSGSWVSAPSENLGFWFSGLRSATYDDVNYEVSDGNPNEADTPATDFISFDLSTLSLGNGEAESFNQSWPSYNPRAEGALVWLPYGNKGMLLAFGGISVPADMGVSGLNPTYTAANDTNSYMTDILVYDVDSNTWTNQQTTGGVNPIQRASFCWVAASTPDNSSHHIYVYGGYDGTYESSSSAFDDVWVLSVPAFQWTKLSNGVPEHRRQNHVCVQMDATTMLSIGGNMEYGQALNSTAFDIYDLSTANWTHTYTPNPNATYSVPSAISSSISDLASIPSDLTDEVKKWLGASYTKDITGPILSGCPVILTPTGTVTPTPLVVKHSGIRGWEIAVIIVAVVIGLAIVGALVFCCCLGGRRRGGDSESNKRSSIISWMHKSNAPPKSIPDSEGTVIAAPGNDYFGGKSAYGEAHELPDYSNPTSPGFGHSGHGSPQFVGSSATSPRFAGTAEVDAQSHSGRHEMGAGSSSGYGNISRSVSGGGDYNMMSMNSETMSYTSGPIPESRHYGFISPYELPHDKSHENLAVPPNDLLLGETKAEGEKNGSTHSLGVGAEQMLSPAALTPVTPLHGGAAGEADDDRPHHKRNQSSMSSTLPNLPSPGAEEDRRRSKLIDRLPDMSSGPSSPAQPAAKKSVFKENSDA